MSGLVGAFDVGHAPEPGTIPGGVPDLGKLAQSFVDGWPRGEVVIDTIRASGIYFHCPREFVLNYWRPVPTSDFDLKSYLKMGTGSYLHEWLQNVCLGPLGVLWGHWIRPNPEATADPEYDGPRYGPPGGVTPWVRVTGYHPDPDLTIHEHVNQRPLTWTYLEPRWTDPLYRISGHVDGEVSLDRMRVALEYVKDWMLDPAAVRTRVRACPGDDRDLLEIKTSGTYQFGKLAGPGSIPDYYKAQAEAYQYGWKKRRTLFWFVDRDTMGSKCIAYVQEGGWLKENLRKARITWEALRDEVLPEGMMACRTPKDRRAKTCPHRKACWATLPKDLDGCKTFTEYVAKCKEAQPDRKWLDLSGLDFTE